MVRRHITVVAILATSIWSARAENGEATFGDGLRLTSLGSIDADSTWPVHPYIGDAGGMRGYASAHDAADQLLRDPDPEGRAAAARALGVLGVRDDMTLVAALLGAKDPSAEVRIESIQTLGILRAPLEDALAPIALSIADRASAVRFVALRAIEALMVQGGSAIEPETAVRVAREMLPRLADEDPLVRLSAMRVFVRMARFDPDLLVDGLRETLPLYKRDFLQAVIKAADQGVRDGVLAAALEDGDPLLRIDAAYGFMSQRRLGTEARRLLVTASVEPDESLRYWASRALDAHPVEP
ncbi:MAG: HEAT repeat domain-containing protein [Acidobacteriota bacterium]